MLILTLKVLYIVGNSLISHERLIRVAGPVPSWYYLAEYCGRPYRYYTLIAGLLPPNSESWKRNGRVIGLSKFILLDQRTQWPW